MTIQDIDQRREAIEAELTEIAKATPGPWEWDEDNGFLQSASVRDWVSEPTHDYEPRIVMCNFPEEQGDYALFANCRTGWPQSLESEKVALTALRAVLELCDKSDKYAVANGWNPDYSAMVPVSRLRSAIDSAWEDTK